MDTIVKMDKTQSTITFVTSFFDIGRKTDVHLQNFDNYFTWIEQLLELPINIYFFTSPELHAQFKYTPRPNLVFKFLPEIPYFDRLDIIREAWTQYNTDNPTKDSPEFAAITNGKFNLLCKAIIDDPFGDTHYAWIDAGILKIATNPELIPKLSAPDKIRSMMLGYINNNETKQPDFVNTCRYKFAGGFFIGPKALMRIFCLRMMAEAEYDLYHKKFGLEQEYMAIIYRRYLELFDPYYGCFCDLIVNYDECLNHSAIIKNIFINALKQGDRSEAAKVAKYITKSTKAEINEKRMMEAFLQQL